MAGAKETPRQKMIGMMYLVLTALLALNVSKSILDAFVTIEENVQKANLVQAYRGDGFVDDIRIELTGTKGEGQEAKRRRIEAALEQMDRVNREAEAMIAYIDELKLDILREAGEEVESFKDRDPETILWKKRKGVVPTRMNLAAVKAQDKYDEPMYVMGIADNISKPQGKGMELWRKFNTYRKTLVELVGTYDARNGREFKVTVANINAYSTHQDLLRQVERMIDANNTANLKEDRQVLIDLYTMLTKKEMNTVHDQKNVHWIGMTFDHSPVVAALALLSSLQNDVLSARALALAQLKSRLGLHEYGFNSIMPLAYGQPIANQGDSVYLQVMMAAFDSDNQPTVVVEEGGAGAVIQYPQDGRGIVGFKVSGTGDQVLKGTVAIRNKSGVQKIEPWEYTVKVMQPSGAISLPQLNVLYRGYDNVVSAVASGFDETVLSGSNVSVSRSGANWVIRPGSGRESSLTVTGRNSVTGKSTNLLTQHYKVLPLPDATLYWGSAKSEELATTSSTKLFARYDPSIPLQASFSILSWECTMSGGGNRTLSGTGEDISSAIPVLRQAPRGTRVYFTCRVKYPDQTVRFLSGMYKL